MAALAICANGRPLKLRLRNRRRDRTDDRMSGEEDMDTKDVWLLMLLVSAIGRVVVDDDDGGGGRGVVVVAVSVR